MYIYNVTTNIQEEVHQQWLEWMKTEHIPEMLKTQKFTRALMSRVLVKEAMGGITYSVQYSCINREMLQKYLKEDADTLQSRTRRFEGKFVSFQTEMEVISEQKN